VGPAVAALLQKEDSKGMNNMAWYSNLQQKALTVKLDLTELLIKLKRDNVTVAAYGAAAKGNTLLNYCGIKNDLIDFVVDANPNKQGKWLPASHIPVMNDAHLKQTKPQYVIILPWNLKEEITQQLAYIKEWGGRFIIPVPRLEII
jgi:hypothetical protein